MNAFKSLILLIIFNFLFLSAYSQQETNFILKKVLNFFLNIGESIFKNFNLNNLVGSFLKTIEEPIRSLVIIFLIIAAVFIFFLFLKNLILTIILLIVLGLIIYLIFSI